MAENKLQQATVLERCGIQPLPHCTAELTLPLLHFDMLYLYIRPVQLLLFFEFPFSKSDFLESIVPTMKKSLAETLSHFLPLAGNVVIPSNSGRPFSRFSPGDSVSLTFAECDHDFAQLTGNHPRSSDELYACVSLLRPAESSPDGVVFPVLGMQVTLFPDRGVCVGFTNHHVMADASSVVRFVRAWATVNQYGGDTKLIGEKSLLPSWDRTAAADPDGLDSYYWNLVKTPWVNAPPETFPVNKTRATFVLTGDEVQKLKNYVQKNLPEIRATSFIAVCAFAWVCLTRADGEGVADDEPEYFSFSADCRGRLKQVPAEYFGNCLALVTVESAHGLLRGGDGVLAAAESIARAIQNRVYNEKGILDGAEGWPLEFHKWKGKRLLVVAGSPKFDIYDVDFGWGRPNKCEYTALDRGRAMTLTKSRDFGGGGLEIGMSRPMEVLDAFGAILAQTLTDL